MDSSNYRQRSGSVITLLVFCFVSIIEQRSEIRTNHTAKRSSIKDARLIKRQTAHSNAKKTANYDAYMAKITGDYESEQAKRAGEYAKTTGDYEVEQAKRAAEYEDKKARKTAEYEAAMAKITAQYEAESANSTAKYVKTTGDYEAEQAKIAGDYEAEKAKKTAEYDTEMKKSSDDMLDLVICMNKLYGKFRGISGKNAVPSNNDLVQFSKNKKEYAEVLDLLEDLHQRFTEFGAIESAQYFGQLLDCIINLKSSPIMSELLSRVLAIQQALFEPKQ